MNHEKFTNDRKKNTIKRKENITSPISAFKHTFLCVICAESVNKKKRNTTFLCLKSF